MKISVVTDISQKALQVHRIWYISAIYLFGQFFATKIDVITVKLRF